MACFLKKESRQSATQMVDALGCFQTTVWFTQGVDVTFLYCLQTTYYNTIVNPKCVQRLFNNEMS